jgi:hypothetical protein
MTWPRNAESRPGEGRLSKDQISETQMRENTEAAPQRQAKALPPFADRRFRPQAARHAFPMMRRRRR